MNPLQKLAELMCELGIDLNDTIGEAEDLAYAVPFEDRQEFKNLLNRLNDIAIDASSWSIVLEQFASASENEDE